MLRTCFLAGLSFFAIHPVFGQNSRQPEYFTVDWQPQLTSFQAKYYRVVEKQDEGYLVKDFLVAGDNLYRTMECSAVKPEIIRDGKAVWYFENGTVESEGLYANDFRTGLWRTYYESGNPKEELIYRGEETLYAQCWSPDEKALLNHGTGAMKEEKDEGQTTMYRTFRDSLVVGAYDVRHDKGDTVYHIAGKMAAYKDGFEGLYREVGRQLAGKYPRNARRMGVEGKVFIQFIVDKEGRVCESTVIKGIGAGCDELAAQAISSLAAWTPAEHEGHIVKQTFVLPVIFRLN